MKTRRGITLIEILFVIGIIALLASILFPVLMQAKRSSLAANCTTNLRQAYVAWEVYKQSNDDTTPRFLREFVSDANEKSILKCPADSFDGANTQWTNIMETPVSYFYMMPIPEFREDLREADANHGILYCPLHGKKDPEALTISIPKRDLTGLVLRLRRDGSIERASVGHMCVYGDSGGIRGKSEWTFFTDAPCPEPWCAADAVPCP